MSDLDVETAGIQSNITVPVGSNLEVDVIVQGASDLRGVNFDLFYDTEAVEVVSVEKGDFLKSGGGQTVLLTDTAIPGTINVSTII
ncbi:MAG: cohesin domain-containing protein [bacterium]